MSAICPRCQHPAQDCICPPRIAAAVGELIEEAS